MPRDSERYVPALGYATLPRLYDAVVKLTTREVTVKQTLVDALDCRAGSSVLDVGCGTATLASMISARFPAARIFGIDGDASVIERGRHKARRAAVAVDLQLGLAQQLPYADGAFDYVVSSLFFHHLSRALKEQVAREIQRVLRPGGQLYLVDWGAPGNALMRALFVAIELLDGFGNTRDNRLGLLPEILGRAGFTPVTTDATFNTLWGTLTLLHAVKPARFSTSGPLQPERSLSHSPARALPCRLARSVATPSCSS